MAVAVAVAVAAVWSAAAGVAAAGQADEARAALRSGRYAVAIQTFEAMLRRDVATASDVRDLMTAHARIGAYEAAIAAGRTYAASTAPDRFGVLGRLGDMLTLVGRLDTAEARYREGLAANAGDALSIEAGLAHLEFRQGRVEAAAQRFSGLIDAYNAGRARSVEDLVAVARACEHLGRENPQLFHDAVRAYDEAIALDPGDPAPRLYLGRLFLDKYNGPEAVGLISEALQLDPAWAEAHLAEAERLLFEGTPEVLARIDRALESNPALAGAHVLRARVLLTAGNREAAAAAARRALDVDPTSLEALGALAATQYLKLDDAGYEGTMDRVAQLNRRSAVVLTTVAEMAAQNRLYADAVELASQAVDADPASWAAWGELGLNQLRIGEIEAGRVSLERAFAGDPFNVWFKNTLDLLDTFPDYELVATEHFELFLRADRADLLAPFLGDLAEEAWRSMTARYGFEPQTPIRIEVFERHADFSVRTVGLAGVGALGVAFGPVIAVDAPGVPGMGEYNWGTTLWHEIGHVVAMGLSGSRVPRWFTEGLSVYEERRARQGWGNDPDPGFLLAYLRDDLLPASRINEGFYRPRYPQHLMHSYVQASLVFEMLDEEFGFDVVPPMLAAYARGADNLAAIEEVVGWDADALDRRFDEYVRTRYAGPLAALATGAEEEQADEGERSRRPDVEARRALADAEPDAFIPQLQAGALLVQENRFDEAEPYLRRAKRLFPGYSGTDSPYLMLARIHAARQENEAAIDELETLLTLAEGHLGPRLWLADLHEARGDAAAAAAALETAFYIDLDRPLELDRAARLHEQAADWGAVVRLRRALLGLNPTDRSAAYYELARAQFETGDLDGARRSVLAALEIAPSYEQAQRLLLELRARRSQS
jgi:tetratricopeptide (TPR) repeat protein